MPQVRNSTKSKIPVVGKQFFPSKKSYTENINPEVENKQVRPKSKPKTSKPVPACPDGDRRRHLSVVDTNTREGGKSSVSDVEGDVFYTAPREGKYDKETNGRKLFPTRGSKEKQDADKLKSEEGVKSSVHRLNALTDTSTANYSIPYPIIQLQEDTQEPLPEGVINIEVDDGLYEYSREVVVYLQEKELSHLVPTGFLEDGSITPNMRSILVDWIVQVQHHLKMCQETLYLAVGILDKVLHRRDVDTDKLQLVGVTALLVASKLEEYYPVDIKKLLHLTENSYTRVEVTRMERTLLSVLEFEVYLPSPQVFLLRFSRAALRSEDLEFLKTSQYLLDSHLPLLTNPCLSPSHLSAAAVAASNLLYHISANLTTSSPSSTVIWNPTLVHYTNYNLAILHTTCQEMVDQVLAATVATTKFTGALVKYKSSSRHQRLALAKHLTEDVLRRTSLVLTSLVLTDWK